MKEGVLNCLQNDMTHVLPTSELDAKKSTLTLRGPLGMVPAITGPSSLVPRWGSVRNWGTSWELAFPDFPTPSRICCRGLCGRRWGSGKGGCREGRPDTNHYHPKYPWNALLCCHSSTYYSNTPPCSKHGVTQGVPSLKTPERSWPWFCGKRVWRRTGSKRV